MAVDAKGRTSMPARYRELLEETLPAKQARQLVVVPWFDGCLRVFPLQVWEDKQAAFDERLADADVFQLDEQESDLRRFLYGLAIDTQLDGQGRILLPSDLREHADLGRETYWVGVGEFLELWQPEAFNARFTREKAAALRAIMRRDKGQADGDASTGEVA